MAMLFSLLALMRASGFFRGDEIEHPVFFGVSCQEPFQGKSVLVIAQSVD